MNKHTLGPWHSSSASKKLWHVGVYDEAGNEIALVKVKSAFHVPRRGADARLIAAAPDLLEACQLVLTEFSEFAGLWKIDTESDGVSACRAAIAKATGATS